jgi:SAM-dependent methyltransferase
MPAVSGLDPRLPQAQPACVSGAPLRRLPCGYGGGRLGWGIGASAALVGWHKGATPRDTHRVALSEDSYYRRDLALVHHRGFGFHARACAPGILALLEPVRSREAIVLELGCGSGLLTRELTAAGHRVIATDASPAMLELARSHAPAVQGIRPLVLPGDVLPPADAVVSVGHVLNYLPDEPAIDQALTAIARALRPGGLFAIDICDLEYGLARRDAPNVGLVNDDWAIITRFSLPAPNRFIRQITTFVPNEDGSWRRVNEVHRNVLIDTARVPTLLAGEGIHVQVASAFGTEQLPAGLRVLIGRHAV